MKSFLFCCYEAMVKQEASTAVLGKMCCMLHHKNNNILKWDVLLQQLLVAPLWLTSFVFFKKKTKNMCEVSYFFKYRFF